MIRYTPSSAAESLSAALLRLSDPHPEGKVSQFLFGSVLDLHGDKWLMVDTTLSLPIHPDALPQGYLPTPVLLILAKYIDAGHLSQHDEDLLTDLVTANLGGRMVVYDAFPQLFKDMSKTREEMISAGLLAEPTMP
jgi:hypothetical protein